MTVDFPSVALLRFPRDDDEFGTVIERIIARVGGVERIAPEYLQELLRHRYPRAVVHAQDPLGGYSATGFAWYVYRDGSPLGR